MDTTKESDKKLLSQLYRDVEAATKLIEAAETLNDKTEAADLLKKAQQILSGLQEKIIETSVRNAVNGYLGMDRSVTGETGFDRAGCKEINLDRATALIGEVEKEAARMGMSVVTAVYNASANPVAIHCMDGAYIASFDIASNKAYTSAALKMPTSVLKNLSQPGQELYGIQFTNQGKIVIFGGGEPLYYQNRIIGALGVSGGTESEDTKLAGFGRDIMEEVMKW
jgi:uncharacterized protein GlcG (DUF336 family)